MIIIINGGSSVGKTSLSKAIMQQSERPFMLHSIDHLIIHCLDAKFAPISQREDLNDLSAAQRAWFVRLETAAITSGDQAARLLIRDGEKALALHRTFAQNAANFATGGWPLIVDEVLWHGESIKNYLRAFDAFAGPIYTVKLTCDVGVAERREKARGDRYLGLARGIAEQLAEVPMLYDLELVSEIPSDIEANAQRVLDFVEQQPQPQAWKRLSGIYM